MAGFPVALVLIALSAGPVRFSGSASVSGEYGWVSGDPLVEPRPELRFSLDPTISFWGFPLSLGMNLSTMESNLRQQLNKYRFFLHPSEWVEGITSLPGFVLSIKSLELGSCHPSWTAYTLSGAPVLGGAFELNPWYVYLGGAAGRAQRAVVVSDSTEGAYSRMLYSGRFGFGKKERTHFFLTGMYVTDDPSSLEHNRLPMPGDTTVPPDSFEAVKPQENYVVGAEFKLHLYDGAFTLESELTGSELTRDNRLPVERWDWLPEWVASTFKPRMSTSVDYAWKVRPTANLLNTRVYGRFEFVGPGYVSLGAPGLRKDNLKLGGGIERDLFNRSVTLTCAYTTERDNLLRQRVTWQDAVVNGAETTYVTRERVLTLKSATTRFANWEASLGISFPNLPYLQAGYYPYTQASDSLDELGNAALTKTMKGNVVSVSAGYSFQTGSLAHSPGVSFSYNDLRGDEPDMDNTNWDLGLSHGLGFEFPLSLFLSGGYSRSVSASAKPDERIYFDLTPSYTLFQVWRNSLTLGATFGTATRYDTRLTSSFPVWKIADARLGFADAIYQGDDGSYNDLRLTAELAKSW